MVTFSKGMAKVVKSKCGTCSKKNRGVSGNNKLKKAKYEKVNTDNSKYCHG